ncbi:hypothetical protein PSPO01_01658 [Paraphaeosphaeria sporulosa]
MLSIITKPMLQRSGSYFHEMIPPEPEIEDQQRSRHKPLPTSQNSPKSDMCTVRVSALLTLALAVVSFVLTLLVVLAGKRPGSLEDKYMLKLNASHIGEDIIRFERASSTASAAPAATTTSSSDPLNLLNPFSPSSPLSPSNTDNPLNQLNDSLEPIIGNLTNSINDVLGDAVNEVIEGLVDLAGLSDFYYLYTSTVCEGNATDRAGGNADGVKIARCTAYNDASGGLSALLPNIQSSIVIGRTNISIPIIAQLTRTVGSLSSTTGTILRATIAFLIISMIGSGLAALLAIPSALFPISRLLVYTVVFFSQLSTLSAFIAALLLTALIKTVVSTVGGLGDALSLFVSEGSAVVVFAWVSWACMLVVSAYWTAVWFVEIRGWSFVRRRRSGDEVGNWKGMREEVWRDLKGGKST